MKKIIENFSHHLDDYECMWNGIEDIYINKTKEKIPDQFFFSMSSFCSFAYIKSNKSDIKRIVSFGDGRTKPMYKFLAPIVNFDYHHIECKTPELALEKAKKEIDNGFPVVIGALDMYYLEYYPKLYHKEHIPFHYILMIGYDDDEKCIYLYDCGRKEKLLLSYENLFLGMNVEYPGLCKPNTICTIRMDNPNDKKYIFKTSLEYKANLFINPPTSFLGVNGLRKFAKELPNWEQELGVEETAKILRNMVDFFGSVPTTPNRLKGIDEKDDMTFMCSRDRMSRVLIEMGNEYKNENIIQAGKIFLESGKQFEILCNIFIDYILENKKDLYEASKIILNIADLEYCAYEVIKVGLENIRFDDNMRRKRSTKEKELCL